MNLQWWTEWFKWAQRTAIGLARSGDFLGMTVFMGEVGQVVEAVVNPFADLATAMKGNWLKRAAKVMTWALNNPDPLGPARDRMRAMEAKWGQSASAPPHG